MNRIIGSILALLMLACGCNLVESPLSDAPISDPSLLQIIAIADRDINSGGSVVTTLRANLYDKHGYYVKVMNGSVHVNGLPMNDGHNGAYERMNDAMLPNHLYTFVVTMSDGSKDSCQVKTPSDLNMLTVPSSYDRRSSLTISWSAADPELSTTVIIQGDTLESRFSAPAGQTSMTLSASSFSKFHPGQFLYVTAVIGRTGRIYSGFMSSSRVTSMFRTIRRMQI